MKKYCIYSICGCFVTGAATATTYWLNVVPDTCAGLSLCRSQPGTGQCCTQTNKVNSITLPSGAQGLNVTVGSRTIKLFNADGTPNTTAYADEQIRNALIGATSGGTPLTGSVIPASEQLVTVTLDMKGGSLPVSFTQSTMAMHPGDLILSAGVTRSDNAKLVGFYAEGASDSTASPIVTVGTATTQKYIAKYTCDNDARATMNSKGTCVDENTVYVDKNGTTINPDYVNAEEQKCIKTGTIKLYDYNPSGTAEIQGFNLTSDFVNKMYYYMYYDSNSANADYIDGTHYYHNNLWYSRYSQTYHEPYMGTYTAPSNVSFSTNSNGNISVTPEWLHSGGPNTTTHHVLYCREHGCWFTSEGAIPPEVMYYLPSTTDCTRCSGCEDRSFNRLEYVDGQQTTVHYYYYQCPCDKQYEGTNGMSICLNESLGCTYITQVVTNDDGSQENQQVCVPNGNYTPAQTNDLIWGIPQPKAIGWTFRGYYLDDSDIKWFATKNTNAGAPVNGFGVGNPNNREMVIGSPYSTIYSVCVPNSDPMTEYDITLYGAWAKNCAPGEGASCSLLINGQSGTSYGRGDVQYTTSCSGSNSVTTDTYQSYQPVCTSGTGTSVDINYSFVNQYADVVEFSYNFGDSCTYGSTYHFLSTDNFNSHTNGYQLRYLRLNNKYFSPNHSLACGQSSFGIEVVANVKGFVCDLCEATNGTCVDVIGDQTIQYDNNNTGTLWGDCKRLQCNEGYTLVRNETTGHRYCRSNYELCIESCESEPGKCGNNATQYCANYAFVCPSDLTLPSGMQIVSREKVDDSDYPAKKCKYTVACNNGAVYDPNGTYPYRFSSIPSDADLTSYINNTMDISCNGDGSDNMACVKGKLNTRFASLGCFTCPNFNGADPSVSPALPTQTGLLCEYNIYCNGDYSPGTLSYNNDPVSGNVGKVRCIASNCTDGYGAYQSLYYLTTEFGKYVCTPNSGTGQGNK